MNHHNGRGDLDARFAVAVRSRREEAGLTQAAVAEMMVDAGYSWHPQTTNRVEHGERKVTVGEALTLAGKLSFTLANLGDPCVICRDAPAQGFTCNKCGRSGQ